MTSPENKPLRPLTPDEEVVAGIYLEACELNDHAETVIDFMDKKASVRWGLGACAQYFAHMTPQEIKDLIMGAVNQQGTPQP